MVEIYLTDVTPLLEAECFRKALSLVSQQRAEKVKRLKVRAEQARSLGAGLLLQYGSFSFAKDREPGAVREMPVPELLKALESAGKPEFKVRYGENGKPYPDSEDKNRIFFNLSHSGEYAVCAFSDEETGVDIQFHKEVSGEALADRFFTAEERKLLGQCKSPAEETELFYFFFTAREAAVKLRGWGLKKDFRSLAVRTDRKTVEDVKTGETVACIEKMDGPEHYSLVVARERKQ